MLNAVPHGKKHLPKGDKECLLGKGRESNSAVAAAVAALYLIRTVKQIFFFFLTSYTDAY